MVIIAILIAKAQTHPNISYAWILDAPWIVPALLAGSVILGLIAIAQFRTVARLYTAIFVRVVPSGSILAEARTAKVSRSEPGAPDLHVTYDACPSGSKLVFSTKCSDSITIRKIGRLVSEEWYRCEHDIGLLRTAYHPIEANRHSECPVNATFQPIACPRLCVNAELN